MRFCMVLAVVLAGCGLAGGKLAKPADSATPITGEAIVVTALDAPAAQIAAADPVEPDPTQADPVKLEPDQRVEKPLQEQPAPVLSPEEVACMKTGGQWSVAGKAGGMSCVRVMKDAGKSCRKENDCEGSCLARSKTCAPIKPLFGCNEILQDNGAMVTLCID